MKKTIMTIMMMVVLVIVTTTKPAAYGLESAAYFDITEEQEQAIWTY